MEISNLGVKCEEESVQTGLMAKKVKEVQQRLAESEEETEMERQAKLRAEKQRADLARELSELSERLEEAGGVTAVQVELNRKREAELAQLRADLEAANGQHEAAAVQMRRRQGEVVAEMGQQVEALQKAKAKLEKEVQQGRAVMAEARAQTEDAFKAKVSEETCQNYERNNSW